MIKDVEVSTKIQTSNMFINANSISLCNNVNKMNNLFPNTKNTKRQIIDEIKKTIPLKLEQLPFISYHIKILFLIFFTFILSGYEYSIIYSTNKYMKLCFFIANIIGAAIFNMITLFDTRQLSFFILLVIYTLTVIASFTLANRNEGIYQYVIIIIKGISICGGSYICLFPYIAITIQTRFRGTISMIIIVVPFYLGMIWKYIENKYLINMFLSYNSIVSKVYILFPILISLPLLLLKSWLSESPRILILSGKYKTASEMIQSLENIYLKRLGSNRSNKSNELASLPNLMFAEKTLRLNDLVKCFKYEKGKCLYIMSLLIFSFLMNDCILHRLIVTNKSIYSVDTTIIVYICIILGALIFSLFINKLSTKIYYMIYCIVILLILATFVILFEIKGRETNSLIIYVIISISSLGVPFSFSFHLVASELYPMENREQVLTVYYIIRLLFSIGNCFISVNISMKIVILIAFVYCILLCVVIFRFGISTNGKSIEVITKDFNFGEYLRF